jgi:hypothetical protein
VKASARRLAARCSRTAPVPLRLRGVGSGSSGFARCLKLGFHVSKDQDLVTGRLKGTLPGATADLKWRFAVTAYWISHLQVAPLGVPSSTRLCEPRLLDPKITVDKIMEMRPGGALCALRYGG